MYLFILSIVISVIVAIVVCCTTDFFDFFQSFFLGFLVTFVISNIVVFFFSIVLIGIEGIEQQSIARNTTPIVAFEVTAETQGTFILGSGTIDTENYFYYIEKTPKGNQLKTIQNDHSVFIKEDNSVSPNISLVRSQTNLPDKYRKWCYLTSIYGNEYTVITIPENSIKYEYNLDLQKLK